MAGLRPPGIALAILLFTRPDFQFAKVITQGVTYQGRPILLAAVRRLVGSTQKLLVENNLDCNHVC